MDAREPSVLYSPVSVVQSNLKAMQRDDVGSCFKFLSPQFRQQVGPSPRFDEKVHVDTRYTPLVGSTGYEVLSALQVGDKRWKVRVRVDNVLVSGPLQLAAPAGFASVPVNARTFRFMLPWCLLQACRKVWAPAPQRLE